MKDFYIHHHTWLKLAILKFDKNLQILVKFHIYAAVALPFFDTL